MPDLTMSGASPMQHTILAAEGHAENYPGALEFNLLPVSSAAFQCASNYSQRGEQKAVKKPEALPWFFPVFC